MNMARGELEGLLLFLGTGQLGPLRPGKTANEVQRLLGSPDSTYGTQDRGLQSEIYFYGEWLELTFENGLLTRLSLRYKWQVTAGVRRRVLKLSKMDADWASAVGRWNFLRFKHFLRQAGSGFWLRRFSDGSLQVWVKSGGSIIFNHRRGYGLYSIEFSLSPHPRLRGEWQENRILTLGGRR